MFSQPAYRSSSVIKARLVSYFSAGIMKAKKFVLHKHPVGEPKTTDFKLVEEELPPVKDGEIAVKTLFLTVDPYMRYMSRRVKIGSVMPGQVVARVLESKHSGYKAGDTVLVYCGWQSAVVFNPDVTILPGLFDDNNETMKPVVLPSFGGLSESLALGVLGMPGITALYGLIEITKPKAGETLVVSTAAGAVGSIVGQLGKILGLKVIGFTGADDKVEWLKKDLKFDYAYNYKTKSVTEALKESAPEGVDIYFDNVGGKITYEVMQQMNSFGRVSCCGAISIYNHADAETPPMVPSTQGFVIFKQLSLHGFVVTRWRKEWNQGIQQLLGYIKQGKLHYQETVTEGFENTPKAFIDMLRGENTGKAIIKA